MTRKGSLKFTTAMLGTAVTLISAAALSMPLSAAAQTPQATSAKEDEIIVTARKRAESIQDVPVSVAALSETALKDSGVSDAADLARAVPGLTIQDGGPGYRTFTVRGVSSEFGSAGTTGFFIDEAFIPASGITRNVVEPLYFDIERIEVLRGPQGTVFGGSAMGGVVRIINKKPNLASYGGAAGAEISNTADGGLNYQINGMVNMPLVKDKLALRMAGSFREDGGFIDKLIGNFTGPNRTPTGPVQRIDDVNESTSKTFRAALAWAPTNKLTITPSFFYQDLDAGGFGAQDTPIGDRDQRRPALTDEKVADEFNMAGLEVRYDFGGLELLSATNQSRRKVQAITDETQYVRDAFLLSIPSQVSLPRSDKLFTQEVRLSTTGDQRFQFVVGAFYEDFDQTRDTIWTAQGFGTLFAAPRVDTREQTAVFGEATLKLTDKLDLTAGLRWYDFELTSKSGASPKTVSKNDGVSPRLSVSYKATGDHLLYASAAQGFRPGGPNRVAPPAFVTACGPTYQAAGFSIASNGQVNPFESDKLWNYEVGAKTSWMDGNLVVNAAAYQIDWDDIQQLYFPACGFGSTQNFGKAKIRGLEVDFDFQMTERFSVFGGFNIANAELAENVAILGAPKGTELQDAPKGTANLNGRLDFPETLGGNVYALVNYQYRDKSYRDFTRNNPRKFQDAYSLVGLQVVYERGPWEARVFGQNLADENANVSNFLPTIADSLVYNRNFTTRPRTFGVSVRRDF